MVVNGIVNDSLLCGYNLELNREIFFPFDGKEIKISDSVTNKEGIETEMMILYHWDFGYPLLCDGGRMVKGKGEITDTLGSALHPEDCGKITGPSDTKDEEVYCHTNSSDENVYGYAAVINDELNLGCYLKYKTDNLPWILQWKNFCNHDYAMGLEPANCYNLGRTKERENNTLPVLKPYETKKFEVSIGILDGKEEITTFENKVK